MASYRAERIAELIHQELAVLLRSVKDPRVGDVSITRVVVTRDLRRATISYLPLGGGEPGEGVVDALASAARHLRGPVGRALGIRHAPELVFEKDDHLENAIRVTSLLDRISRERAVREGPAEGEPVDAADAPGDDGDEPDEPSDDVDGETA